MKAHTIFSVWIILLGVLFGACSNDHEEVISPPPPPPPPPPVSPFAANIDTFTFSSNGADINGKIYLPDAYATNHYLPAIYLIDYKEQHFKVATDEHDQVILGVQNLPQVDALIVTLEEHPNIDSHPNKFQTYYDVFRDMTAYVDSHYTYNPSRTFIGRGSEGGIVLLALFLEDPATAVFENFIATDSPDSYNSVLLQLLGTDTFPPNMGNKKVHFSFSSTNNHDRCTELINTFEAKQYPWLTFGSMEYSGYVYENTYPIAFAEGLAFVFK